MIATRTLGPVAWDARVWRLQGNLRVTVAIKATFELVHRSPARLRAPLDLIRRDVSFDRDPAASVERVADLVPLRLHTDLTSRAPGERREGSRTKRRRPRDPTNGSSANLPVGTQVAPSQTKVLIGT